MFGMKKDQNHGKADMPKTMFDLEEQLKNPAERERMKKHVEMKINRLQEIMREGNTKTHFDHFSALLHGYKAFLTVMNKVAKAKK